MAWLYAVPKAPKSIAVAKGQQGEPLSRIAQMKRDGMKPILPEPGLDYLVEMFLEAGPTIVSGFGAAPLSHAEIRAYQANKGIRLSPWEAIALRKLSLTYIEESERAKDPDATPPYSRLVRISRQAVDDKLTALGI